MSGTHPDLESTAADRWPLEPAYDPKETELGGRISAAWQKTVSGVIETGQLLIEAKAALPHGQFQHLVKELCPFSRFTANKLMAIAQHPELVTKGEAALDSFDNFGAETSA